MPLQVCAMVQMSALTAALVASSCLLAVNAGVIEHVAYIMIDGLHGVCCLQLLP